MKSSDIIQPIRLVTSGRFYGLLFMSSAKKVLVVDDDADLRLLYHVLLAAHHYDTFFASDALSAVAKARAHKPDLIILDLGLSSVARLEYSTPAREPGGFLVMERLRADTCISAVPIIIVSGRDAYANRERALRGGAMAFVQKPWDNDTLLAIISRLL
jgi:two-component system, cell cycle response regulator DivK